jgi:hypothetical protein
VLKCPDCGCRFEVIADTCSMHIAGFEHMEYCPFCGVGVSGLNLEEVTDED